MERDDEGVEFPDLTVARADAIQAAQDIIADDLKAGKSVEDRTFEVCDENGALVAKIPFKTE